jgi:hypothetical protein
MVFTSKGRSFPPGVGLGWQGSQAVFGEDEAEGGTLVDLPFGEHLPAVPQDQPVDARQAHTRVSRFVGVVQPLEQVCWVWA